jgi:hypothetical protein
MDVVINTANGQDFHFVFARNPANILPKTFANILGEQFSTILCRPHNVINAAGIRVSHEDFSIRSVHSFLRDYTLNPGWVPSHE